MREVMSNLLLRWRALWKQRQLESDLEDELAFHLAMREEKNRQTEVTESARRSFGNVALLKEDLRDQWTFRVVENFLRDLRYAVRMLRHSPGFTFVAVLSLALGIGANTAVFSVMDTVLLKTLPVKDPQKLVLVTPQCNGDPWIFRNPTFRDLRERQAAFSGMFAVEDQRRLVSFRGATGEDATYLPASVVSGNYFSTLGVRSLIGRMFRDADEQVVGMENVRERMAVIGFGLWQRQYGGDPATVGKRLWIDHHAYTIIGIAPREFHGHQTGFSPDIWTPMNQSKSAAELNQRDWAFFSGVMARLKPSMTTPRAEAAMTALYRQVLAAEVRQGIESSLLRDWPSAPPDRNISHYQIAITPGAQVASGSCATNTPRACAFR
jgi:hypothetical protein